MLVEQTSGASVVLDEQTANTINQLPTTRRAIRLAQEQAQKRNVLIVSASLAALVGTATASLALTRGSHLVENAAASTTTLTAQIAPVDGSAVSRSSDRSSLPLSNDQRAWSIDDSDTKIMLERLSAAGASSKAAQYFIEDAAIVSHTFDLNHAAGDTGNAYGFSQCTWWVYIRRHQLGLPVGSHMGNGHQWGNSARALGYWVDNQARHVGDIVVFRPGQLGADPVYGHVGVIESIAPDGSFVMSETSAGRGGRIDQRSFTASQAAQLVYVHY